MRVIIGLAFIVFSSSALPFANAATPAPKASHRATPTPTPSPSPGSAVGLVTWQYNDFVGTKPDVGASACLIPKRAPKVSAADASSVMLGAHLGSGTPETRKYGWICGTADGSGSVNLDVVPAGTYSVFVISRKTTRDFTAPLRDTELSLLAFYFADDAIPIITTKPSALLLYKWAFPVSDVIVRPGGVSHFSYDFGHTYA